MDLKANIASFAENHLFFNMFFIYLLFVLKKASGTLYKSKQNKNHKVIYGRN